MREVLLELMEDKGVWKASLKVERMCALLDQGRKVLCVDQLVSGSAALRTRVEGDFKGVIAEFADSQTQPSAPVPAPVLDMEPAEPPPKKKRLLRLEERCEAGVRVAAGGGGDSGSAEPQALVTGQRVLIGRGVLVYLTEQGQLERMPSTFWGLGIGGAPTSVYSTTSTVASPAEMPYLAFIARLYHGIEATSCQAERIF